MGVSRMLSPVQWLLARWYSRRSAPWVLRPLAVLYVLLLGLRRGLYRRGWLSCIRLDVPVVVVGNLTLGGTGKTPLVIALADALRQRGWTPGVVSRGHGGGDHAPQILGGDADPRQVGDEPCLIMRRSGAPVAVGRDRPAAAQLLREVGVDVIIADDGLQHYRLARDVDICVVDGMRRYGNGWPLPAGPLREPLRRLRSVDFRVCNGGLPQQDEILMRLLGDSARRVDDPAREQPLHAFANRRVHAVAGIGNPARFFESLRIQRIDVIEHPFPDHHPFVPADLDFRDELPVLMTEKDAVKCAAMRLDRLWYVPIRAMLPDTFLDAVTAAVDAAKGARRARRRIEGSSA